VQNDLFEQGISYMETLQSAELNIVKQIDNVTQLPFRKAQFPFAAANFQLSSFLKLNLIIIWFKFVAL